MVVTAVAFLGLSTLEVAEPGDADLAGSTLGLPAHSDWVDRVVGSDADVSLVGGAGSHGQRR